MGQPGPRRNCLHPILSKTGLYFLILLNPTETDVENVTIFYRNTVNNEFSIEEAHDKVKEALNPNASGQLDNLQLLKFLTKIGIASNRPCICD